MSASGVRRGLAVAATTAMVLTCAAPAAASDWRGWKFLGTTCGVNSAGLIYAHVRVRTLVQNTGVGAHWASNMRVKARLVHPGSGFQFGSSWRTARYPAKTDNPDELLQDHSYSRDFAVNTDAMSPNQDWRLQIRLIWDRKLPWGDAVEKFDAKFISRCPPARAIGGT